jgi:hypothetical protein
MRTDQQMLLPVHDPLAVGRVRKHRLGAGRESQGAKQKISPVQSSNTSRFRTAVTT